MIKPDYRPGTPQDLDLLFSIEQAAFSRPFDNAFNEVDILGMISRANTGDGVFMLVQYYEEAAGYYSLLSLGDELIELEALAILPRFQGQGFGKLVMEHIIKEVSFKADLQLTVHPKNVAGLILYLKNGFIPIGYKEDYYGDGQPRLLMKRTKS
ncbi:GNAT family N-acetyltransferase [Candidatus Saccharibacteria bacterium]|nr:GNAT family N-acetyltransferase [Candidatus Saccharibacteria bacterium]